MKGVAWHNEREQGGPLRCKIQSYKIPWSICGNINGSIPCVIVEDAYPSKEDVRRPAYERLT
jgi:hypothetical protein